MVRSLLLEAQGESCIRSVVTPEQYFVASSQKQQQEKVRNVNKSPSRGAQASRNRCDCRDDEMKHIAENCERPTKVKDTESSNDINPFRPNEDEESTDQQEQKFAFSVGTRMEDLTYKMNAQAVVKPAEPTDSKAQVAGREIEVDMFNRQSKMKSAKRKAVLMKEAESSDAKVQVPVQGTKASKLDNQDINETVQMSEFNAQTVDKLAHESNLINYAVEEKVLASHGTKSETAYESTKNKSSIQGGLSNNDLDINSGINEFQSSKYNCDDVFVQSVQHQKSPFQDYCPSDQVNETSIIDGRKILGIWTLNIFLSNKKEGKIRGVTSCGILDRLQKKSTILDDEFVVDDSKSWKTTRKRGPLKICFGETIVLSLLIPADEVAKKHSANHSRSWKTTRKKIVDEFVAVEDISEILRSRYLPGSRNFSGAEIDVQSSEGESSLADPIDQFGSNICSFQYHRARQKCSVIVTCDINGLSFSGVGDEYFLYEWKYDEISKWD
ncbi:hypothetical protein QAD02_013889 [Eretmocerus hayati]|uniref:Uncharacterized protein n=1 Tax=Eretmocerus hayati TaxID=131215 RepID=A0ACC2P6L1_9HYME|nr:hypothetical protein QAD02_013889 [Eretmocerus hayati]